MDYLAKLRREIARPFRPKGAPDAFPLDFTRFQKSLVELVGPYAMTSKERIAVLETAVRYVATRFKSAAFVECGVAKGGSSMAIAYTLADMGATDRDLYLYDTFEGMPEPSRKDKGRFGESATRAWRKRGGSAWIRHGIEEVLANMSRTGFPSHRLHLIKGKVEETLPACAPVGEIAFLRLDTDWYSSTKVELEVLYPQLVEGGIILVDDYHRWQGSRTAVDEYVASNCLNIFWMRIDDSAVMGVKQ